MYGIFIKTLISTFCFSFSSGGISNVFSEYPDIKILSTRLLLFGFIYLTHVFATQELLGQVQQLQREYEQTQQVHDELKLRHDRMTGPANIYRKARELGFINAGPADQILEGQ